MSETTIILESIDKSVTKLGDVVERLALAEERRLERDKHQEKFNDKIEAFMEGAKPILSDSKKFHQNKNKTVMIIVSIFVAAIFGAVFTF
jgi:hypothetical protein